MTDEIQSKDSTDVQKSTDSSIESLIKAVSLTNDSLLATNKNIEEISKSIVELQTGMSEIKKMQDANPVDHGTSQEQKPKVSDNDDVGDKTPDKNGYAPDGDAQASINASDNKSSGTDKVQKGDDDSDDKKKEEKKDDEVKKSFKSPDGDYEYVIKAGIRPKYTLPETGENTPTGYQIYKAILEGWGGKYTNYEQSFIEGYTRLQKGEFGTGDPYQGGS